MAGSERRRFPLEVGPMPPARIVRPMRNRARSAAQRLEPAARPAGPRWTPARRQGCPDHPLSAELGQPGRSRSPHPHPLDRCRQGWPHQEGWRSPVPPCARPPRPSRRHPNPQPPRRHRRTPSGRSATAGARPLRPPRSAAQQGDLATASPRSRLEELVRGRRRTAGLFDQVRSAVGRSRRAGCLIGNRHDGGWSGRTDRLAHRDSGLTE